MNENTNTNDTATNETTKKAELRIFFCGARKGDVSKMSPICGLALNTDTALDYIAKLPEAYNITPNGKRFVVDVPCGTPLAVVLASRSVANWCGGARYRGALKVIHENARFIERLPVYLEAEANKKATAAALAATRGAIAYWGKVEKDPDTGSWTYPSGCPEYLARRWLDEKKEADAAAERFTDERKALDKIVMGLLRPAIESYFTAEQK